MDNLVPFVGGSLHHALLKCSPANRFRRDSLPVARASFNERIVHSAGTFLVSNSQFDAAQKARYCTHTLERRVIRIYEI
jgi:hypothetical protein